MKESEYIKELDNNMSASNIKDEKLGITTFDVNELQVSFCSLFKHVLVDVIICMVSYFVILVVALLRGGHGAASIIGIQFCSFSGWLLFLASQILCIVCSYIAVKRNADSLLNPNKALLTEKKEDYDPTHKQTC